MEATPQTLKRLPEVDLLRGIAITGMVFFSLNIRLVRGLPDWLMHNRMDGLHIGDFVFTLFLFTSGLSLALWGVRHAPEGARRWKGLAVRILLQVLISIGLSPFIAGHPFGTDEVMVNALLSLPCVLLAATPSWLILAVSVAILASWFQFAPYLPSPLEAYLGGYFGAFYYLPVMLSGVLAFRYERHSVRLFALFAAAGLLVSIWVTPLKMFLAPSFMLLASGLGFGMLALCRGWRFAPLEYLGRRPLRYWVFMCVIFIIPLHLRHMHKFKVEFDWITGDLLAIIAIFALYYLSRLVDFVAWCFARDRRLPAWR